MNRSVAPSGPAGAVTCECGVIFIANKKTSGRGRALHLRMAAQTEIRVANGQHLRVDRAMRVMTTCATFTEGRVLKNEGQRLLSMTLRAVFIKPRHGESAGGLHDVHAVGIMALNAIHFSLNDRVVLRKLERSTNFLMTLKAALGIPAGIDDELFEATTTSHRDMFATRAVTGFATALASHLSIFHV